LSSPIHSLIQAVAAGDENAVRASLSEGGDVNTPSNGGQTPLILAVVYGHLHLLHLLLKAGADPLIRDNTGLNAIDWAQRRGLTEAKSMFEAWLAPLAGTTLEKANPPIAARKAQKPRTETIPGEGTSERPVSEQGLPSDEKARRWIAGLRQRFEEKARQDASKRAEPGKQLQADKQPQEESRVVSQESARSASPKESKHLSTPTVSESTSNTSPNSDLPGKQIVPEVSQPEPAPTTATPLVAETSVAETSKESTSPTATPSARSSRKRCPQCNAIYDDELIAYCAHHIVRLVDADAPMVASTPTNGMTPLLWVLVAITLAGSAYVGYLMTGFLEKPKTVTPPVASAPGPTPSLSKGIPVVGGNLVGASTSLPGAECPLTALGEAPSRIVIVRVRVDPTGHVYWTRSSGGNQPMREAAVEAATKTTFSPEKLGGRRTQGTITYTFQANP
jgi:TonB family protein